MLVSIFTMNSTGWGYVAFGELVGKGVKEEILQDFWAKLNEIPGINIPQDAISLGKFPSIPAGALTEADNLKSYKDAVLALCQQIES